MLGFINIRLYYATKTILVRMHLILITFGHTCTCFVIASLLLQYYFSCIHETTSSKREMLITVNYILSLCPQKLYLIDYNVFIICVKQNEQSNFCYFILCYVLVYVYVCQIIIVCYYCDFMPAMAHD